MRITKRKGKGYSGQMRLPEHYKIKVDGFEQGTIQETAGGWFWYGVGHNTLGRAQELLSSQYKRIFDSPNEALADFKEFYEC